MTAKPPPLPPRQRASVIPPPPTPNHSGTSPEPTPVGMASMGQRTTIGRVSQVPRPAPTAVPHAGRETVPDSTAPQTIRTDERQDTEPVSPPAMGQGDDLVWDESDLAQAVSYSAEPGRNSSVPPSSEQLATSPTSAPPTAETATFQPPAPVTQAPEAHTPTEQNRTAAPDAKHRIEQLVTQSASRASSPFAVAAALALAVILFLLSLGTEFAVWQVGTVIISSVACVMTFLIHFTLARTRTELENRLQEMQDLLRRELLQATPAEHRERAPMVEAPEWGSKRGASSSDAYDLRPRDSSRQARTALI